MQLYPLYLMRTRAAFKRDTALQHCLIMLFSERNLSSWAVKILPRKHQDENTISIDVVLWAQNSSKKMGSPLLWLCFIPSYSFGQAKRASTPHHTRPFLLIVFLLILFRFYFLTASHLKSSMDFMWWKGFIPHFLKLLKFIISHGIITWKMTIAICR